MAMPAPVPIRMPFIGLPIARPNGNPARMHKVRKHPPALVVLPRIGAQWQSGSRRASG